MCDIARQDSMLNVMRVERAGHTALRIELLFYFILFYFIYFIYWVRVERAGYTSLAAAMSPYRIMNMLDR